MTESEYQDFLAYQRFVEKHKHMSRGEYLLRWGWQEIRIVYYYCKIYIKETLNKLWPNIPS